MPKIELCNALPRPLMLWFEPWAQEFELPAWAVLTLRCSAAADIDPAPTFDAIHDDALTIWGAGGSLIAVLINGIDQNSFTGQVMAPDAGPLSSKEFVNLVFGDHPGARPGWCASFANSRKALLAWATSFTASALASAGLDILSLSRATDVWPSSISTMPR